MWKLRVKLDSWSSGLVDEKIRQRNRELLIDEYLLVPPARLWMYLSACRYFLVGAPNGNEEERVEVDIWGPEDSIARGES